ncbi:hypothetical protein D3C87_2187690 [compost metagenome]
MWVPSSENTAICKSRVISRKLVPHRGWMGEKARAFSGVSSLPASTQLMTWCSAPWYWKRRFTSGISEMASR